MKPFSVILLLRNVQVCLRECGPGESVGWIVSSVFWYWSYREVKSFPDFETLKWSTFIKVMCQLSCHLVHFTVKALV